MNEKIAHQIEKMKKQTIGVEVEMNNIKRDKAARLAADFFGTGRYENTASRNGYMTWSAWDEQGREWKFQKDVSIAGDDAHKCEMVTPILKYEDMETLQELIRKLRKAGTKSDATRGCGVHIHIGAKGHTPQTMRTAKYLYMILYDRARISRKNSWIDKYGNVYLIFPIEELSVQIGKCKSSVKTALKELDDVGLLVRRSGGFSKPNHLYVKIPSDEIGLQPVDDKAVEKMVATESEKQPSSGRKNGCAGVGNVAPSKVTEKYKRNKYHEVNYCYGEGESL